MNQIFMCESDKLSAEKSFFGDNDIMALSKLAEIYFEEKKISSYLLLGGLVSK